MLDFKCRVCKSTDVLTVIDLGNQYLSDFRLDDVKPKKYPLELLKCRICHYVQLRESAPLNEMYTENYGFKSGVNDTIKSDLKSIVDEAKSYVKDMRVAIDVGERSLSQRKYVLDIGSNDGTLLSNYSSEVFRVGIDPITKLCEEAEKQADVIINDFFSLESINRSFVNQPQFDIITAISMFYDVEDPDTLVSDISKLLKRGGVLTIQQNYLLATLVNKAYDNICHEHIGYHSLMSMEYLLNKHDLEVVDVSTSMVNGGVLRTVIQHKGVGIPSKRVQAQRDLEKVYMIDTDKPFLEFRRQVHESAMKLKDLITRIKDRGEKIYIYGASTRGGTIWQYVGLDVLDLPYAVERNPGKWNRKIASVGVPIISEEQARRDAPDYMLVSIWFFKDEIIKRESEYLKKGRLIFPLPDLDIV